MLHLCLDKFTLDSSSLKEALRAGYAYQLVHRFGQMQSFMWADDLYETGTSCRVGRLGWLKGFTGSSCRSRNLLPAGERGPLKPPRLPGHPLHWYGLLSEGDRIPGYLRGCLDLRGALRDSRQLSLRDTSCSPGCLNGTCTVVPSLALACKRRDHHASKSVDTRLS